MFTVINKNRIVPGQKISFVYSGGSNPGMVRVVTVETVDSASMTGYDHYRDGIRQFYFHKIPGEVELLLPVKIWVESVDFAKARRELYDAIIQLTGEQLAKSYGLRRNLPSRWNTVSGCVELEVPEKTFVVDGETMTLTDLIDFCGKQTS